MGVRVCVRVSVSACVREFVHGVCSRQGGHAL